MDRHCGSGTRGRRGEGVAAVGRRGRRDGDGGRRDDGGRRAEDGRGATPGDEAARTHDGGGTDGHRVGLLVSSGVRRVTDMWSSLSGAGAGSREPGAGELANF
mmetsp:Transcript_5651/g.11866  ORF Transcript_5651/g.11866 Transcript_5651/m.11866 type:complete len:103 (+) Transcript_5651:823-1131(+)